MGKSARWRTCWVCGSDSASAGKSRVRSKRLAHCIRIDLYTISRLLRARLLPAQRFSPSERQATVQRAFRLPPYLIQGCAMRRTIGPTLLLCLFACFLPACASKPADDHMLHLNLRSRAADASSPATAPVGAAEHPAAWDPHKTAIIVVDMWDDHWCSGAARRVSELAVPMNAMLKTA